MVIAVILLLANVYTSTHTQNRTHLYSESSADPVQSFRRLMTSTLCTCSSWPVGPWNDLLSSTRASVETIMDHDYYDREREIKVLARHSFIRIK